MMESVSEARKAAAYLHDLMLDIAPTPMTGMLMRRCCWRRLQRFAINPVYFRAV
jgi:hypothetical protein